MSKMARKRDYKAHKKGLLSKKQLYQYNKAVPRPVAKTFLQKVPYAEIPCTALIPIGGTNSG